MEIQALSKSDLNVQHCNARLVW